MEIRKMWNRTYKINMLNRLIIKSNNKWGGKIKLFIIKETNNNKWTNLSKHWTIQNKFRVI